MTFLENTSAILNRLLEKENNSVLNFPELLEEWVYEVNGDPRKYSCGSHYRAEWKCKTCEYVWKTRISHRTSVNSGCPSCSGKIVSELGI